MLNFSALSSTSVLGRALRLPLKMIPSGFVMPVMQGPLRGRKWVVGSSNHGCWLGSYEVDKQAAVSAAISEGDIVYDIGANVGFYTLLSSARAGSSGRVISFEPLPSNVEFLRKHIALNGCANVDVRPVAISDRDGEATFQDTESNATGRLAAGGGRRVRTETIDGLLARGEIPPPSIVKIDIEGAEGMALRGARQCLIDHHPMIFLATHGPEVHKECTEFLAGLGYEIRSISGHDDELIATHPRARNR